MSFLDFDDDDPKLNPGETPENSGENSPGEESGLFAPFDSTPLDNLVGESGMVIKKGGRSGKKRAKKEAEPAPESEGLSELESEELLRAIVGSVTPPQPASPVDEPPTREQLPGPPADDEMQIGAENAPTGETASPSSGPGIFGLVKKVTSTLGINRSVKEDSPLLGGTPFSPAGPKTPAADSHKQKNEADEFDRQDQNNPNAKRPGDLNMNDQADNQKSTPSPFENQTGSPTSRKRKAGKMELPSMDLDNPQPVEESDWIKTVTGVLLGHEEPEAPNPEELKTVTSRLDTLGAGAEEGPQAMVKPVQEPASGEPVSSQPAQRESPFGKTPEPGEESKQPEPEQNAEFQAFLGKLQQEGQEESHKSLTSKLDDDLLNALLSEAGQGEETQDNDSLSRLSSLDSATEGEGPADPAYWRISTRPLGKDSQAGEPPVQMSPFSMDIESWDGRLKEPATENKITPPPPPESSRVGGVDISSWDLPPEVQEMLEKQKSGTTIQSPFDGTTMDVPVDQPEQTSLPDMSAFLGFEEPVPPPPAEESAEHPLLAQSMIDMPDFFAPSSEPPAADAYKDTSPLLGFSEFDFPSSPEEAPAAEAYRNTSQLGRPPTGNTSPFDLLSQGEEKAPAEEAYLGTSPLSRPQSDATEPLAFPSEGEAAPAEEAYRETSPLSPPSTGDTEPFVFLSQGEEEAPAAEAYKDTRSLMSNIEPPDASFFFTDQPATFGEAAAPKIPSYEEKTQTTPLSRRIESPVPADSLAENDLRSMFTPAPSIAEEAVAEAAAVTEAAPVVETAPKPVAAPKAPMSARTRLLLAFGGLAAALAFVVILVAVFLVLRTNIIPAAPFGGQAQPQVSSAPVQVTPIGLELTGGWTFSLQRGDLKNGVWTPQGGAEWLNGTELRRIVALPWNPQLEAVVQTFKTGDPVRMMMNNNDIVTYRIDKVETVTRDQVDVLQGNTPALIVILYRNDSNDRLVILGH